MVALPVFAADDDIEAAAVAPGVMLPDGVSEAELAAFLSDAKHNGKAGTVKIGSEAYELANGAVFLVLKTDGKPKVQQLKLTALNLKPEGTLSPDQMTHEYLRGLARTSPEINGFFAGTVEPK